MIFGHLVFDELLGKGFRISVRPGYVEGTLHLVIEGESGAFSFSISLALAQELLEALEKALGVVADVV